MKITISAEFGPLTGADPAARLMQDVAKLAVRGVQLTAVDYREPCRIILNTSSLPDVLSAVVEVKS